MDLSHQIAWERECLNRGSERYYANQDRLRDTGQIEQSDVISYLFKERMEEVATELQKLANKSKGAGGAYNKLLKTVAFDNDYMKVAYIGTQCAFHVLMAKEKNTVLKVCLQIATRLEADLKCRLFEKDYPAYYAKVSSSFKDQKVSQYSHKHKVMMKKFGEFNIAWNDWTHMYKLHIGQRVLQCIVKVFDDVLFLWKDWSHGKSTTRLDTTPKFDEWAAEFERERGFMFPVLLPLKIPPKAWEEVGGGGYYTNRLIAALPFIKTKGKDHRDWVANADPEAHREAVNKMQRTAWTINNRVLEVQRVIYERGLEVGMPSSTPIKPIEFPEHLREIDKANLTEEQKEEVGAWKTLAKAAYAREQQRKGKVLSYMQISKLALELSTWEKFYFAYNCDFRGRIYCATTGLSPQGSDNAKGLLKFARGVRLGTEGLKWLAIQGANTYGEDKITYEERVDWAKSNEENIRRTVEDPIRSREFWGNADKPYQFLAFCFDWADCDYGRDKDAKSHIPVGLDGSCNGLQHYSAMLRDEVGGAATNLIDSERPNDIYGEVAQRTIEKLMELDDARATKWLQVGVSRKCAKRPVMTLPYGAKQQSARVYVLEYVMDNWAKFELDEKHQWEYAKFLTPILWEAIGEVVIAARAGMDWIQRNVGKQFVKWKTPLGFPVYQFYKDVEDSRIETQLLGTLKLRFKDLNKSGGPHKAQQRNGIAPNFVHSVDSTHMVATLRLTDLNDFAMIHDDFGTHAGNTQMLFENIRKAFKWLYSKHDPLQEWADQVGVTEPLPEKGNYNIEDIISAKYFFG